MEMFTDLPVHYRMPLVFTSSNLIGLGGFHKLLLFSQTLLKAARSHMNRFPKTNANSSEKSRKKMSIPAAFKNPFMGRLSAFRTLSWQ
jgi:hypothetical protein